MSEESLGGWGGSDPSGLVEEKGPLGFLVDDSQLLSGTGDSTGLVGETGLTMGGIG